MKGTYELTVYDSVKKVFLSKFHYSNRKAALGSFIALKEHIIEKYGLRDAEIKKFTFSDGGDHQTEIIDSRYNITIVKWNVSDKVSIFC